MSTCLVCCACDSEGKLSLNWGCASLTLGAVWKCCVSLVYFIFLPVCTHKLYHHYNNEENRVASILWHVSLCIYVFFLPRLLAATSSLHDLTEPAHFPFHNMHEYFCASPPAIPTHTHTQIIPPPPPPRGQYKDRYPVAMLPRGFFILPMACAPTTHHFAIKHHPHRLAHTAHKSPKQMLHLSDHHTHTHTLYQHHNKDDMRISIV